MFDQRLRHARLVLYRTLREPYDTLDHPVKTIKTVLQMLVGVLLIFSTGAQVAAAMRASTSLADVWSQFVDVQLLDTLGDGLLVATAIELGYMLFTDGPDEAINPPLTALAAAILLRIPSAATNATEGLQRAIEVGIYVLMLTLLLRLRARFIDQERQRKTVNVEQRRHARPVHPVTQPHEPPTE